ncbi:hypothetical protein DP939_07325 [Spongiactinospora rosea]|uniref:Alpha/beta hydrolase n=1 Tax=Spongiactinospora rosea TaxID=2248750 RepID=A0A366M3V9_9ACTN|nr:hypothetical protein DP939_07325 [Spongiactinospora rosea]
MRAGLRTARGGQETRFSRKPAKAADVPARIRVMADWYAKLAVPGKEHTILPGAGHRSMYEQPERFARGLMRCASR